MALISTRFENDNKPSIRISDIQEKYIRIFKEKCENGIYSFRRLECECGNGDFETIAQKDRYGIAVNTVICRNCGLIKTNPCLDDTSNNAFYDNEYPYIYRSEEAPSDAKFVGRKNDAATIIRFIRKHTARLSGNVLEIGCADGGNVAAFCESGYVASGIDLSHTYIEYGKTKGLDLYCCDATSFAKSGRKFDIIVMNHVLEHFTDIRKELRIISDLLNPDGLLFIAVPGVENLSFGAYNADFLNMLQNAHIYNFTEATLRHIMVGCGFECIYSNEFIYGVFKRGDVTAFSDNAYGEITEYLQAVEKADHDILPLLIYRAKKIISRYNAGEVLLYGTSVELDVIVQQLDDVSPIMGFFYSEKKSPQDIRNYLRSLKKVSRPKCLFLADSAGNTKIIDALGDITGIDVYSVYSVIF